MSTRPVPAPERAEGTEGVLAPAPPTVAPAAPIVAPAPPAPTFVGARARHAGEARRGRQAPAPPPVEVRRSRRVLRRVDTWSLFRFAVLLYGCALVVFLAAAIGLWIVASAAGAIPSIETFITQLFALKKFHFKALQLFVGAFGIGIVWVLAATLFTVITGVLYNLISDVVGGIEITVLEEEPLEPEG
ncbi:MAG TPA: DUF3566 domain-containing protein [Acidimicrobiales bacterium]